MIELFSRMTAVALGAAVGSILGLNIALHIMGAYCQ